jgi:hypothetical protein
LQLKNRVGLPGVINRRLERTTFGVAEAEGKFTYFASSAHPGTIQELITVHDGNRDLCQMITDSAINWDGKDPIR